MSATIALKRSEIEDLEPSEHDDNSVSFLSNFAIPNAIVTDGSEGRVRELRFVYPYDDELQSESDQPLDDQTDPRIAISFTKGIPRVRTLKFPLGITSTEIPSVVNRLQRVQSSERQIGKRLTLKLTLDLIQQRAEQITGQSNLTAAK